MKHLILAALATLPLAATPAFASDYGRGLRVGDAIATCHYITHGRFNDPNYGPYMLKGTFDKLSVRDRNALVDLWQENGDRKCLRAVR